MPAYGYTRVSTLRQADEGESLLVQERMLKGYATMLGHTLTHIYIERGVSGGVDLADRPEGAALLAVLRPGDIVMTTKLDRMFRSASNALKTLQYLQDNGVTLHMIDLGGDVVNSGASKLIFTIIAAVSESERDRIRERISTVKRDQRQRGRYLGGIKPYGYRVEDGALVEIPEQQEHIRLAREARAKGYTIRWIQEDLAARGSRLSLYTVHKMVTREQT